MLCAEVAPSVSSIEVVREEWQDGYSSLGLLETGSWVGSSSSSLAASSSPSSSCASRRSAETREQARVMGEGLVRQYLISR